MRWGLLLIPILIAPLAQGASAVGELLVQDKAVLPTATTITSVPAAFFVPNASAMDTIQGTAAALTVRLYEERHLSASIADQRPKLRIANTDPAWQLHDVLLTISPENPGWLGIHASTAEVVEEASEPIVIEPQGAQRVGTGISDLDRDQPSDPYYLVHTGTGMISRTSSEWGVFGAASAKIFGPSVTLEARENTTTITTGQFQDPTNPAQIVTRWLVLETSDFSLNATETPARLFSKSASVTWEGEALLGPTQGAIEGEQAVWKARGSSPESLAGRFSSSITASPSGDTLTIRLEGDLRTTTLGSTAVPRAPITWFTWWPVLLAIALGVAGGSALVLRRKPARGDQGTTVLGADEYADLADRAADAERFDEAAEWASRARELSPTSKRLALDQAFFLFMSGAPDRARYILEDPLLSDDADAALLHARLLIESGDFPAAGACLARALHEEPLVLLDIESDPGYAILLQLPEVQRARRDARRRIG